MIVRNFNLVRISCAPFKANAPLVIDANTVLSRAIHRKFLKAVARWHAEIIELFGRIQDGQFTPSDAVQRGRKASRELTLKEQFSFSIPKALYHTNEIIACGVIIVKLDACA